jgi:hypothetical protein
MMIPLEEARKISDATVKYSDARDLFLTVKNHAPCLGTLQTTAVEVGRAIHLSYDETLTVAEVVYNMRAAALNALGVEVK